MNAKELYLTIGQISDDLILGANAEQGKRKKPVIYLWTLAAAACFCLMLGGGYLYLFGTSAVWNSGTIEFVSKASIPGNSTVQILTDEELSEYYHITTPDVLNDMSRLPTETQLYTDVQDGAVLYDRNLFRYEDADGSRGLNLILSRVSAIPQKDGEKVSRIQGTAVTLTEDDSISGYLLLSAQWEKDGTTFLLTAEGLDKDELIAILNELI